ncbi:MAG: GH3 auxin-responsive promoter family protein, partial [Planctomycetota bacterium]
EFYPVDETGPPEPRDLLSETELEQGRQYFIYVTTLGGLYRYDMNDIIAVEGFHGDAPVLRFVQKGKGVVSFTGEKLYEAQVIKAAAHGLKPMSGEYEFIAVLGEMADDKPRYVFLVEFENAPGEDEAKSILARMERSLRAENMEYATKRDSHRIDALALRIIRDGEFDRYRRREVEKGKLDGQFKILRLTTDKEFAAEFKMDREVQADPSQDG